MTQVADGTGGARGGSALPIRLHDLLLGLAGRIDDDALADARELLASSELDRALELVAGCLASGRVPVTGAEKQDLTSLLVQAHCDPSVVEDLPTTGPEFATRHRFGSGAAGGVHADQGVAEAARRVLDALPDIRAVWCVWRLTPAGPAAGPVPHRIVLIGVGPAGYAPATAYRIGHALSRAGITASVEVLRDGAEPTDYHRAAMRYATEVPLDRAAPVSSLSASPSGSSASPSSASIEPPRLKSGASRAGRRAAEAKADPAPAAEKTPELPKPWTPDVPKKPALKAAPPVPDPEPEPELPKPWTPDVPVKSELPSPLASSSPLTPPSLSTPLSSPVPEPQAKAKSEDESLNDQELDLLRQLQEELARREHSGPDLARAEPWQDSLSANGIHPFDWQASSTSATMVNGMPPQPPDRI